MVRNHARKNAARSRRAATGETHRQAVEAVRHDQAGGEAATLTAVCTPNSHPGGDGRVEHGYQLNVLDQDLNIVATVDLPDWGSFRPASAGHRLAEHGYMIRPDARGPQTFDGWRQASPGLDSWSAPVVRVDGGGLALIVDYPVPELGDATPCPHCAGTALSDEWFEQPSDGGRLPLITAAACSSCGGCGRAEHDECPPGAHVDDDEGYGDHPDDQDGDGEWCPSCGGREFTAVQSFPDPADPAVEEARAELLARARARGVGDWEIPVAASFDELDELLGEGAQALMDQADRGVVYLLVPCGCAEGRARVVNRSEFRGAV